jgi:hypothetical protein
MAIAEKESIREKKKTLNRELVLKNSSIFAERKSNLSLS